MTELATEVSYSELFEAGDVSICIKERDDVYDVLCVRFEHLSVELVHLLLVVLFEEECRNSSVFELVAVLGLVLHLSVVLPIVLWAFLLVKVVLYVVLVLLFSIFIGLLYLLIIFLCIIVFFTVFIIVVFLVRFSTFLI